VDRSGALRELMKKQGLVNWFVGFSSVFLGTPVATSGFIFYKHLINKIPVNHHLKPNFELSDL